MRKHITTLFMAGVSVVSHAYLPIQIWIVFTFICGAICLYMYRKKVDFIVFVKLGIPRKLAVLFWVMTCVVILVLFIVMFGFEIRQNFGCNIADNLPRFDWAIEEENTQHFEQELRKLYLQLEKCGLQAPLIDPVSIGESQYDSTWYGFHLTFLKALRRQVRNGTFNLKQWNSDVERENDKRLSVIEPPLL